MNNIYGVNPLYAEEIAGHVASLFEALVRFDENEKAYELITQCVPYFLSEHEFLGNLRNHQTDVTAHLRNPTLYAEYYGNNPHELPYEEMFRRPVGEAGTMPRIAWLEERIKERKHASLIDLACNDGAILRYLLDNTDLDGTKSLGVDLNPTCIERAKQQRHLRAVVGRVDTSNYGQFDAAFAGEVIEHVPDPVALLSEMAGQAEWVYVTTPLGATEKGLLGNWMVKEFKGHVRSPIPTDIARWCADAGLRIVNLDLVGGDTMCLEARDTRNYA